MLIASDAPLDAAALQETNAGDGVPLLAELMLTEAEVDDLLGEGRVVMLTDLYAPVDQMLTPVYREEVPR